MHNAPFRLFNDVVRLMAWTVVACAVFAAAPLLAAEDLAFAGETNVMVELPFTADRDHQDPFNKVAVDVVFTDPTGRELRVPAFWAGKNVWKARYASPLAGTHTFRSESHPADEGLHGVRGRVQIKRYSGSNPLYVHGPLRVADSKHHLEHADGTPFFWLGDTWWMGLSKRLTWPEDFRRLAQDRKQKGFNVVQIVVGPPPDSHPFDPRSVNEQGFPWEKEYTAIRPAYFDAADERIMYLVDEGFTPCLFGMWGYHIRFMGLERAKQHWRYLVARYGALPVVWSAAGEANLPWYLAPGFPYHDHEQVRKWTAVTRYLREIDPFKRLVTVHPTGIGGTSRDAIDDATLLDFDMLQTPHGQHEAVPVTLEIVRRSRSGLPAMPTINGEAAYEMLNDTLPTRWTRQMFWLCMTNGAAGHTYGANGIWQVNGHGDPHGPSPHMPPGIGYGAIAWDQAMNLAGSQQVALGKKLLEQFEWHKFRPDPQWAVFAEKSVLSFEGCAWIWFPEGNPAEDAPASRRFFTRTFVVPDGRVVRSAKLRITVDDQFAAWLNRQEVGRSNAGEETWRRAKQFDDVARHIRPGTNVLAIEAENMPAAGANPAGLLVVLEVQFADGEPLRIVSDHDWTAVKAEVAGWDAPGVYDATSEKAMVVMPYGQGPWGRIDSKADGAIGPQSTGIAGVVRLTYIAEPQPIVVQHLEPHAEYSATIFDPITGASTEPSSVRTDASGNWKCAPPGGHDHDWVLILRSAKLGNSHP